MVLPREVTGIDLAAVLGIDERSVRKLTTKNVLKRTALGYDFADASHTTRLIKMPDSKDDPRSSEWRPYMFARDQWHCRICGDRFLYSEMVRKHIANEHNETMPPSMYEYFHGAVWQRKKLP